MEASQALCSTAVGLWREEPASRPQSPAPLSLTPQEGRPRGRGKDRWLVGEEAASQKATAAVRTKMCQDRSYGVTASKHNTRPLWDTKERICH